MNRNWADIQYDQCNTYGKGGSVCKGDERMGDAETAMGGIG